MRRPTLLDFGLIIAIAAIIAVLILVYDTPR